MKQNDSTEPLGYYFDIYNRIHQQMANKCVSDVRMISLRCNFQMLYGDQSQKEEMFWSKTRNTWFGKNVACHFHEAIRIMLPMQWIPLFMGVWVWVGALSFEMFVDVVWLWNWVSKNALASMDVKWNWQSWKKWETSCRDGTCDLHNHLIRISYVIVIVC